MQWPNICLHLYEKLIRKKKKEEEEEERMRDPDRIRDGLSDGRHTWPATW